MTYLCRNFSSVTLPKCQCAVD